MALTCAKTPTDAPTIKNYKQNFYMINFLLKFYYAIKF